MDKPMETKPQVEKPIVAEKTAFIKKYSPQSLKIVGLSLGILLVALSSFAGGVMVGFHKARFSYAFGENYERNFGSGSRNMKQDGRGGMMERFGFLGKFDGRNFRNAHGTAGTILSITDATILVKDKEDKENAVVVTDKTLIKSGRTTVAIGDLKAGDRVVIVGQPEDNGTVNADLMRVFEPVNTIQ